MYIYYVFFIQPSTDGIVCKKAFMYENNQLTIKKNIFSVENESCEDGICSCMQTICFQGKNIFIRLVVSKHFWVPNYYTT